MWRFAALLALGGCDIVFHIDSIAFGDAAGMPADGSGSVDAGPCADGTLIGDYGMSGHGLVQLCVPSSAMLVTPGASINTDTVVCDSTPSLGNGFEACVMFGTTITFAGVTNVTGARPLVIAAADMIDIPAGATLDVSATPAKPGPGGDVPNCDGGNGGTSTTKGGGGGGGASWGTVGGSGGAAGAAGQPGPMGTLTSVRGGCKGGTGGAGLVTGGDGGHGGGAIYLVAPTVTIEGMIFAEGGGGVGGNPNATAGGGGGGGGSGGLIAIDTRNLGLVGMLSANGGGGGGGGGASAGGGVGQTSTSVTLAASGGTAGAGASSGGDGAIRDTNGQTAGPTGNGPGAGGGGGGQGIIVVYTSGVIPLAMTSPTLHYD